MPYFCVHGHILYILTVLVKRSLIQMPSRKGRHTSLSVKCCSFPPSGPAIQIHRLLYLTITTVHILSSSGDLQHLHHSPPTPTPTHTFTHLNTCKHKSHNTVTHTTFYPQINAKKPVLKDHAQP